MTHRRIAECECSVCHTIVPKTEAEERTVEKKSGRIGWGWSVSQRTDGSGGRRAFSSSRDTFRNATVWVCHHCIKDESVSAGVTYPAFALMVWMVGFGWAWHTFGLIATLGFLLVTPAGWICIGIFGIALLLAFYGWKRYDRHFYGSEED